MKFDNNEGTSNDSRRTSLTDDVPDRYGKLALLNTEKMMINASIRDLEVEVKLASEPTSCEKSSTQLITRLETLRRDIIVLMHELEKYKDVDPCRTKKKREDIVAMKAKAERWTNNIEILEGWVCRALGIGYQQLDCLRRECYGPDYVEGEAPEEL
ncbi:MAG: hypothetical protein Q9225_006624 [Loekoesia sp. 1 TL-2023]